MSNQHSTMQEYEVYLQARPRDYQAAQADGKLIRAWFGAAIYWLGSRLVAWGHRVQPKHGHMQPQNPPSSWVS